MGCFEVMLMNIYEVMFVLVKKGSINYKIIICELMKELNFKWSVKDGKLMFDVDYSDILKKKVE